MPKADTDHTPATPILPKMHSAHATAGDDAELIRLCERIVVREAEEEALCGADPHAPDAGPHHVRYLELTRQSAADSDRLYELPPPTTPEGARALARAALAIVPRTHGGEIITPRRSAERLAWGCAQFLAGRAPAAPIGVDEPETWSILDIETFVFDFRAVVDIFHHLINSPSPVEDGAWAKIQGDLTELTTRADQLWKKAWEEHVAKSREHEAAMEAARAEKAAPGSAEDEKRVAALWELLAAAAAVAMRQCAEAGYRLPGWQQEAEERS